MKGMLSSKILKIVVSLLIFALFSGTGILLALSHKQMRSSWDYPRLDNLYMVIAYPEIYALEVARACAIDNFVNATKPNYILELTNPPYNWSISENPGFHMAYLGINCRDVTPETSGQYWDYHGRTPGLPLYPLNLSAFRTALELIVSGWKTGWVAELYSFLATRLDQVIPPANKYWYNPCITEYPSPWNVAWTIAEQTLVGAGFVWNLGPDSLKHTTDDSWLMPNGDWLWNPFMTWGGKYHSERYAGYCSAPGEDAYGIWVMPPGIFSAPRSYLVTKKHTDAWNRFFCSINDTQPCSSDPAPKLFMDDATDSSDQLTLVPFYNRDHDIYFHDWHLDRNPNYLYDLFHPDVDVEGGKNTPGLNHLGLNRLVKTIEFWKLQDYEVLASNAGPPCEASVTIPIGTSYGPIGPFDAPAPVNVVVERVSFAGGVFDEAVAALVGWFTRPGLPGFYCSISLIEPLTLELGEALEALFPDGSYHRLITDIEEMKDLVYLVQWKFYCLVPYLPIYSRNYINLYKPGVTCWVESKGYGSETTSWHWTLGSLHWEGTPIGGSFDWHNGGAVNTLNPITASSPYELNVLTPIIEGLMTIDPYTHVDIPWIACKWQMVPWVDIGMGVDNGMIVRFWLRDDVYWQDGSHVTAKDVAWNFEFLESLTPPEYEPIWSTLVKTEVRHEYLIDLYVNATSYWKLLEFAASALTFPKIIWFPLMGDYDPLTTVDYTTATQFQPWAITYEAWTGCPDPILGDDYLTCLMGTGPYIFQWWDTLVGQGLIFLKKHYTYWMKQAAYPNAQLPQIVIPSITYKKIVTGPTFLLTTAAYSTEATPYPGTVKEPLLDPSQPISSWWYNGLLAEWAHLNSWVDDDLSGTLSVGDNIDMLVDWPDFDMHGIYNFHVDEFDFAGPAQATMIVSVATIIPTCTKSYIEVTFENVNTKELCNFGWVLKEDTTILASGSFIVKLDPCSALTLRVSPAGQGIRPCMHNFTLEVTNADGTTTYSITAAWLVGDGNMDGVTDMADIDDLITLFLTHDGEPGFNPNYDFNDDDMIDMADIDIAIIHFLDECNLVDP
jgi:ABC-type transport system substrate-binding protein